MAGVGQMDLDGGVVTSDPAGRAISLTQPWATLVAHGHKRVETRGWPAPLTLVGKQRIAIHAAKGTDPIGGDAGLLSTVGRWPFLNVLRDLFAEGRPVSPEWLVERLPRGVIVATALIGRCLPTDKAKLVIAHNPERFGPHELEFGDYDAGRYGWRLDDVVRLGSPIECRPRGPGVWSVPADVNMRLAAIDLDAGVDHL